MGERGGRGLKGIDEPGFTRLQITLPPSIAERLERYTEDEERAKSWCISKALDKWLAEKGY